jgi:hypothetical protein
MDPRLNPWRDVCSVHQVPESGRFKIQHVTSRFFGDHDSSIR